MSALSLVVGRWVGFISSQKRVPEGVYLLVSPAKSHHDCRNRSRRKTFQPIIDEDECWLRPPLRTHQQLRSAARTSAFGSLISRLGENILTEFSYLRRAVTAPAWPVRFVVKASLSLICSSIPGISVHELKTWVTLFSRKARKHSGSRNCACRISTP